MFHGLYELREKINLAKVVNIVNFQQHQKQIYSVNFGDIVSKLEMTSFIQHRSPKEKINMLNAQIMR